MALQRIEALPFCVGMAGCQAGCGRNSGKELGVEHRSFAMGFNKVLKRAEL